MKQICAWCGRIIREGCEPISHGICKECRKKELASLVAGGQGRSPQSILDSTLVLLVGIGLATIGVLILNL